MAKDIFRELKKKVIKQFINKLDSRLYYHNQFHILDVLKQSVRIAKNEGILDSQDLFLLKTSALYHDIGCLFGHHNHEEVGCEIVRKDLKIYNISEKELTVVCNLILSTKIPQVPNTLMERVICDADLDYLGRIDFYTISEYLKKEFLAFGIVKDEKHWQETQIKFFHHHHYFTASSQKSRNSLKMIHLAELKNEFEKLYHD